MKKSIYLLVSFLFLGFGVYGQMPEDFVKEFQFTSIIKKHHNEDAQGVWQVPVVVHVMHLGEPVGQGTNISDADVRVGIQGLNNRWRKMPGTLGDGNGVDMEVEFLLAVRDPDGNPTNGIVRKNMSQLKDYVDYGVDDFLLPSSPAITDSQLKKESNWPNNRYLNIWTINKTGGKVEGELGVLEGYGSFPHSLGTIYDGVVILASKYAAPNSNLAHEVGHVFGLRHPFSDYDACKDGDGIDDTPKQKLSDNYNSVNFITSNECDPNFNKQMSPTHSGDGTIEDIAHNYMGYFSHRFIANEFTFGQKNVARNVLVSLRNSFLSEYGNKALVPALNGPPAADFSFLNEVAIKGSSFTFFDQTFGVPNSYTNTPVDGITFHWTFDNGVDDPMTSTVQNPTITFDHTGTYDVTLTVTNNAHGEKSHVTKSLVIREGVKSTDCMPSSKHTNHDQKDFKCGVTNVSFHTLNNLTSSFIPKGSFNDFTGSKNTVLDVGKTYDLSVKYQSYMHKHQYLQVWIDWDNSGTFQRSEMVLSDHLSPDSDKTASNNVIIPANAVPNKLLRMRVISSASQAPKVCGEGSYQRADDYGVMVVVSGCTDQNASNYASNATLDDGSCKAIPEIGDVIEGGVVYKIDTEKEIAYLALKEDLPGQSGGDKYQFNCHNRLEDQSSDFQSILRVVHEKNLFARTKDIAGFISCGEEKVASQACMDLNSHAEEAESRIKYFLPSLESFKEAAHEIDLGLQNASYWTGDMDVEFETAHPNSMLDSWMFGDQYIEHTRVSIYDGSQNETFALMSELHYVRPFATYTYGKPPLYDEHNRNFVPKDDLRILEEQIPGCLDTAACNFNDQATDDDGSCTYPIFSMSSVTACDTYEWEGQTVTSTQDLKHAYGDATGCGVHTVKVMINNSSASSENVTACDSYDWNGTTYNTSGTYAWSTTNAVGCDSTATLNLTINNSNTGFGSVRACDSYTWEGQTVTSSQALTHTYTNASGCDSVLTLNVTISHPLSNCDVCENGMYLDQDGDNDGVCDDSDNCFSVSNTDQLNTDGDTAGDACDPDDDDDGCLDIYDANPLLSSSDTDGDGYANDCDPDDDNDGVLDENDSDDNNAYVCSDTDGDGCNDCSSGSYNVSDDGADNDYDGVCDAGDNCIQTQNADQMDWDGDGVGNACEIVGCYESEAFNYNPDATDAGNCIDVMAGIPCGVTLYGDTRYTPQSAIGHPSSEHIYRFEVTTSGTYEFSTCGSDFDTYLRLYDTNKNEIRSNDDACGSAAVISQNLTPGTYYVLVEGYSDISGTYELTVSCPAPLMPIPDPVQEPEEPEEPQPTSFISCGDVKYGNTLISQDTYGNPSPDDIYQFEVTTSGTYKFSTCGSGFDTYLRIYDRFNMAEELSFANDNSCSPQAIIEVTLNPGTYNVVVEGGLSTSMGSYELTMDCSSPLPPIEPEQEEPEEPEPTSFISCGDLKTGNTSNSQDTYGNSSPEDIYQFEVTTSGTYEFSTCGSAYDTYLRIYNANMNEMSSNDDAKVDECEWQSIISQNLIPGTYYVLVEGYSATSAGIYELRMTCSSSPPPASECYQINMHDTFGDGWNGSTLVINGIQHTLQAGQDGSEEICFDDTECVDISVSNNPWPHEVLWGLTNRDGETVLVGGAPYDEDCVESSTLENIGRSFSELVHSVASDAIDLCPFCRVDSSTDEEEQLVESASMQLSSHFNLKTNLLTLEIRGEFDDKLNYQLYDIRGRLLDQSRLTGTLTNISMGRFPESVYLLKVSTEEKLLIKTFKIVKH